MGTRHNVGFLVVEELSRRHGASSVKKAFSGETAEIKIGDERVLLLCPHTFMNLSGGSVRQAVDFYKIETADVLVVGDDMNLPVGKVRVRATGSSGGQKGLADILNRMGTQDVARLRLGIGRPPDGWEGADYVLAKFSREDAAEMGFAVPTAADAVEVWVKEGIAACMNRFN